MRTRLSSAPVQPSAYPSKVSGPVRLTICRVTFNWQPLPSADSFVDLIAAIEEAAEVTGLPVRLPSFPRRAYLSGLLVDKKKTDKRIRFVVLNKIGKADTVPLTPAEIYPAVGAGR